MEKGKNRGGDLKLRCAPYNARLHLCINEDMPTFGTKGRRALTMRNTYYPSNQRRAPSNVCLPLVTKADTSLILHKLRRAAKMHVSFLPSPVLGLPSRLRACLTLTDQRQPPIDASLIRVSYLSFLHSVNHQTKFMLQALQKHLFSSLKVFVIFGQKNIDRTCAIIYDYH
jgi:hypothetical protein